MSDRIIFESLRDGWCDQELSTLPAVKSSTNLLAKRSCCLGIVTYKSLLQGVQCTVQSSKTLIL